MSEFFVKANELQDWIVSEIIWAEFPSLTFKEFLNVFQQLTGRDAIQITISVSL